MGEVRRLSSFVFRLSSFDLSTFLIVYLYWVAFEWILLSRIPSMAAIQVIRNTVDVLPLAFLILSAIVLNIRFKASEIKILAAFAGIVIISVISLAWEGGPVESVFDYIGVTIRFVPLLILVRFASDNFFEKLFSHIKIIYWLMVVLAIINLINKDAFILAFLPPSEIFGEVLPTTYTDPGISASFINTVEFAFFFLGLTVIYLNGSLTKSSIYLIALVSSVLIVLSFSIASILALIGIFWFRSKRKLLVGTLILCGLTTAFVFLNNYIEELLGMDIAYWIEISSEFNRLGYITKVLPEFLTGHFKDLFLGMGYDAGVVDMKLNSYKNTTLVMINNENNLKYLKDVYWLSILFVQGVVALGLTLGVLRMIWRKLSMEDPSLRWDKVISCQLSETKKTKTLSTAKMLILVVLFLGFFNQVLDIKAFTYIFWLVIAVFMERTYRSYSLV